MSPAGRRSRRRPAWVVRSAQRERMLEQKPRGLERVFTDLVTCHKLSECVLYERQPADRPPRERKGEWATTAEFKAGIQRIVAEHLALGVGSSVAWLPTGRTRVACGSYAAAYRRRLHRALCVPTSGSHAVHGGPAYWKRGGRAVHVAAAAEENVPAVRGPACWSVAAAVPGQPPRHPALGRHHPDVALVGECDPAAFRIGRRRPGEDDRCVIRNRCRSRQDWRDGSRQHRRGHHGEDERRDEWVAQRGAGEDSCSWTWRQRRWASAFIHAERPRSAPACRWRGGGRGAGGCSSGGGRVVWVWGVCGGSTRSEMG